MSSTESACHRYGSLSGCDERCPALHRGDCPEVIEALEYCNMTEEEKVEIMKRYKKQGVLNTVEDSTNSFSSLNPSHPANPSNRPRR